MDTSPACKNTTPQHNEEFVSCSSLANRIQTPRYPRKLVPLTRDLQLDTTDIESPESDCSVINFDSDTTSQQNSRRESSSRHCFKNDVDFIESRYQNIISLKDNQIISLKEQLKRARRGAVKFVNFEDNIKDLTEPNNDTVIKKLKNSLLEKETEIIKLKEAEHKYIADARIYGENLKRMSELVETKTLMCEEKLKSIENQKASISYIIDDYFQDKKLVTDKTNSLIAQLKEKLSESEEKLEQCVEENKNLYSQLSLKMNQLQHYIQMDSHLITLNEHVQELEALIEEKDKEIDDLNERIQINESAEVMTLKKKLNAVDKQLKEAVDKNNQLDDEMSKLMGHQNNLQKIRYVSQLKSKYNEVLKDHQKLLQENRTLEKENQILKQENQMLKPSSSTNQEAPLIITNHVKKGRKTVSGRISLESKKQYLEFRNHDDPVITTNQAKNLRRTLSGRLSFLPRKK